jgi:tetratricopeptide (TPR) repeat protein
MDQLQTVNRRNHGSRSYHTKAVVKAITLLIAAYSLPQLLFQPVLAATSSQPLATARQQIKDNHVSEQTLGILQKEIEANPNSGDARALLGQCYDMLGMRELAREQYDIANRVDPNRSIGVLEHFHYTMQTGDPADAFLDWVQIRKQFPLDPEVRLYEEAIARCFQTVAAAEQAYLAEKEHGHNLRSVDAMLSTMKASRNHEYELALNYANFEMDKHINAESLFAKAFALNGLKRSGAARLIASESFRRNAIYPGAGREYAIACMAVGSYKEAVNPAVFNLVVWEEGSASKPAEELLAQVFSKVPQKDIDEAMKPAKDLLGKSNLAARMNTSLFHVYKQIGRNNEAERVLTKGASEGHLSADGWYMYGQLMEQKNDLKAARAAYQEAALVDPTDSGKYEHACDGLEHRAMRLENKPNDLAWQLKDALRHK